MMLNVIEKIQLSPATKSSDEDSVNSFSLPLTFFELRWIKFHPNERVIFYRLTESSSSETFHSRILPNLKLSLSHVLRYYLPLAGRLTWAPQDPRPSVIVSKHDTVSLTVAETDADFSFLTSNELRPATEFHPLVPELEVSDDSASLLSVQVTLFPNQGFCIGITSHHSVNDGATSEMFIKSWAHICRNIEFPFLPEDLTPSFDRTVINISPGLESKMIDFLSYLSKDGDNFKSLKPPPLNDICPDVVRVTLELTSENVEKLRERVKKKLARSPLELHLSTFVIAYAYAWTCAVKARGGDADRPVRFIYTADFRARLDPPLPATYFGSCVAPSGWFQYEARTFLGEDGFVKAAEILSDSVKDLGLRGTESLFEDYLESVKKVKLGEQAGSVAGSTRLGINGTDFGWGKPVKTEFVSIDRNEAFSMLGRRDGAGGVEIGVCLKKSEMNTFLSLFKDGLND
ncbi:unnamed protein product [Eruca vesicaria subsp. sativa]|uniref:Uncharacterized protein n=1 Tax=Eruca vesicaria subsp. sativa TaxID=29727 RepID=A0ABC8JQR6_ERUVS|nr:unnamed protein product [Eruca vesicaria subsp. sativa]